MSTGLAWAVLVLAIVVLGAVGYHFSLRTVRIVTTFAGLATVAGVTLYGGLAHPDKKPATFSGALGRGADALSHALFHAKPGQTGWIIIAIALVIGYRELEAWTLHGQARSLDTSALGTGQADGKQDTASSDGGDAVSDQQHYDRLVAELKFRLPAVEVRAPAILPGGSRSGGLASIAEASGFAAAGLTGAIINFLGMLWPGPRKLRVRVWMERTSGHTGIDDVSRVTVHLDDPRTGLSIATKTLAACGVDDAASVVAGYVARYIFIEDRTAPPWCTGAADGRDLAALLLARQVRDYPESEEQVRKARDKQIHILEGVARGPQCAGVVRYELAQLHDLTGRHLEALFLHAINRAQYPHFYRGRYRLAMSLEMIANPSSGVQISMEDLPEFNKILEILRKSDVLTTSVDLKEPEDGEPRLSPGLQASLLDAASAELHDIRRYLSLPSVLRYSFRHRDERAILRPYWRLPYRQAFHDGVDAALLMVAIRRAGIAPKPEHPVIRKPRQAQKILRIAAAITGDSAVLAQFLGMPGVDGVTQKTPPMIKTMRTRHWYRQDCSRSWQAGYNLACAYAAVVSIRQECAGDDELCALTDRITGSLEFTACNPECEMERPGDWIATDPDFGFMRTSKRKSLRHKGTEEKEKEFIAKFGDFLAIQKQRDYPSVPLPRTVRGNGRARSLAR